MRSLAPGRLARLWASAAAAVDVNELLTGYERAGVMVVPIGDRRYPSRLAADPEAPSVLFARGRFTWHQHPAVSPPSWAAGWQPPG
jgi:predicted Rossmann fold nucleotide-binding protein DprA/Smf involved in DNA uptake